jgi:predicted nucleic acid-binding protein
MSDEVVLDASVAVDWLLSGSRPGGTPPFLRAEVRRSAPDLIFAEFVFVASRLVRRGLVSKVTARETIEKLPYLLDEVAPLGDLAVSAYDLAARYSFSTYDAIYLSLALRRGVPLVTADVKLARRAVDVGMADRVRLISPES